MNYPLISEYLQAVSMAEDNLDKLSHLRPVSDSYGECMRSSGAFAVVFKMHDPQTGKYYALKCFTEDQSNRSDSYALIAKELSEMDSSYLTKVEYYDKELYVHNENGDETEFPVLLMDWVDGVTMEQYVRENHRDSVRMQWLCYRFCRMASWLRSQPFAHGDIKPDNVLVRPDGSLALVDYDGMFVPAMKGMPSPTLGTRDFSHPDRKSGDFDESVDDFALASIALSLKAIALNPALYGECGASDRLLFSAEDYRDLSKSATYAKLQSLLWHKELATLMGQFQIALGQKSLQHVSFRLFNIAQPHKREGVLDYEVINEKTGKSDFHIRFKDGNCLYFKYLKGDNVCVVPPTDFLSDKYKGYTKPEGNLQIPPYIDGQKRYSVTVIGDSAFCGCSGLQSIVIPDSVTEIDSRAFPGCSGLQSIVIPDSVTKIGWDAFSGCRGLQSIVIPDSVIKIGNSAFSGCSGLQSMIVDEKNPKYDSRGNCNAIIETITHTLVSGCKNTIIPDSVTKIGGYAFSGCSGLQNIVIPDSVTEIGKCAFSGCSGLQSIVIPDSVTEIGKYAFRGCSGLQSIVIPDSVTGIGESAFSGCSGLQSIVIPDSVTVIGWNAFSGCSGLQSIIVDEKNTKYDSRGNCNAIIETITHTLVSGFKNTVIPDSVKVIGGWAFYGCSGLQSIVIPDSVTEIGDSAFRGCSGLQSIVIPDSVTEIGLYAFSGCSGLQSIIVDEKNTKYDSRGNCNAIIETITHTLVSGCKNTIIPDSVTVIGGWAFYGCSGLQSIVIPDSVTKIGCDAFSGCSGLRKIKINDISLLKDSVIDLNKVTIESC